MVAQQKEDVEISVEVCNSAVVKTRSAFATLMQDVSLRSEHVVLRNNARRGGFLELL